MDEIMKNTILIVDDDSVSIMTLTKILSPEYTVYAVKDGQDAIEKAEEYLPDVILLDIVMQGMDGYSVIAALKNSEKTQDIPIIFITGLNDADNEEKGLALGAVDYVTKPFKPTIIKLRVQNQIKILNHTRLIIEKEIAEQSNRAKIEFLLRMNHVMLTPMNSIMGMTEIAKMSGNQNNACLDEIETASRQLLRLINDLLDISGNKDRVVLADSYFSVNAMFVNVLKEIDRDITEKQHTLTYDIDPSIPALLIGDEKRLGQVITNLLTNAIKFTPEMGEIHFSACALSEDNDLITLQVEITDNGIGISKKQQGEIFSIFKQADESLAAIHGGAGLGLPLAKRIVELMGGKIWIDSEPDKGSKFTFTCKLGKG